MIRLLAVVVCMLAMSIVSASPIYTPLCMVVGASGSSGSYAYPLCPSANGGVIWYDISGTVNGQQQDATNISTLTTSLNDTISTVNGHTTSIDSLNSSVSSNTTSLNNTISQVNTNTSNISALQTSLSSTQLSLSTAQSAITDLQNRVSTLESAASSSPAAFDITTADPAVLAQYFGAGFGLVLMFWAFGKGTGELLSFMRFKR